MDNQNPADELLDLVDENDNIIGQKKRSEVYAKYLTNYKVINAFVINNDGKLWIPRRSEHKRIFPSCLDMSVGGHVESGEDYDTALKRETLEELNIDLNITPYKLLGHLTPKDDDVSANMNVYEIKVEIAPNYNKSDFIEYFWLTPQEFFDKIAAGDKSKDDLPKLINKFYRK